MQNGFGNWSRGKNFRQKKREGGSTNSLPLPCQFKGGGPLFWLSASVRQNIRQFHSPQMQPYELAGFIFKVKFNVVVDGYVHSFVTSCFASLFQSI